jgi:hypothetical protein
MYDDLDFDPTALRSFLADGPARAPAGAIDPVLAQVRRQPRRRFAPVGLLVRLREAGERLAPTTAALRLAWIAVLLALLVLALLSGALVGRRQPALPGAMNGLIAVAVGGDVWLLDPGSEATTLLATPDLEETALAWSPDGRWIAVALAERSSARSHIDLVRVDGERRSLTGPYDTITGGPVWSLDGELVLFTARSDNRDVVLSVTLDGSTRELASASGAAGPSLAPDGRMLAFTAVGTAGPELWIIPLEAGPAAPRSVSLADIGDAVAGAPTWAPNGLELVLGVVRDEPGGWALVRVWVSDGTVEIVDGPWSSDPGPPALAAGPGGIVLATSRGDYVVEPGETLAQPTQSRALAAMAVSPDGRWLAELLGVACGADACPVEVATIRPDTGGAAAEPRAIGVNARIPNDEPFTGFLSWQPLLYPVDEIAIEIEETCTTISDGRESRAGTISRHEDVVVSCIDRASDPRLSGTRTITFAIEIRPDQSATLAGSSVLRNDDGEWAGTFSGSVAPGYTTHEVDATAQGSGAFAGLRYRFHLTGDGDAFSGTGTVGPGD